MKLAVFSLTLLPTVFAVAIGISKDPFENEPSHELSKEFSNWLSNIPSSEPSSETSNEPSNDPSDILAPLNIDFQTNKVMEMEALDFITNLTNTLISEVTQYAQQAGLKAEDLISFPCTPAPAKKEKRQYFKVHPMWHRLGVKSVLMYNKKKPFLRACLAVLKHAIEGKSDVTSNMTNSTISMANSTVYSADTVGNTN